MHRFFEGFLYPSYTGGVVVPFRSEAAETMWTQFASLWKDVNPNSTSYNFMQEPLLSGDVWIAFDHIARVLDAKRSGWRPEVDNPPIGVPNNGMEAPAFEARAPDRFAGAIDFRGTGYPTTKRRKLDHPAGGH
jgi:hypothetical protein